ncbi:MAG: hypothetical protein R3F59_04065 [Myxococcota bacterium]
MPRALSVVWLGLMAACAPPPETTTTDPFEHPCATDAGRLDLAPPGGDFGDITPDGPLWCGNPPQGGAPYTPFRVRVRGPEAFKEGVALEMVASDVQTGEELAYTELTLGLTCANVGESAGFWVGSEAHMRYDGWGLDELDGRTAAITVTGTAISDASVEVVAEHEVVLVLERTPRADPGYRCCVLLTLPLLDPSAWIRVDDPDYPGALARSPSGAVLAAPPTDGTPWRPESLPVLDDVDPALALPGELGDPVPLTHADLWHERGFLGQGVKVAIFDLAWFGGETDPAVLGDHVTTHDCYTTPSCEAPFDPLRPHAANQGGVHGWGCAEAIHRIAPEAELHLYRTDSLTLLESASASAAREGVDVISLSMSFYSDSFGDGTGPHAELIDELTAAGALMVTSSGNDGRLHWGGTYVDADGDGRMDGDGDNGAWLYLDRSVGISLYWDQFGLRCGQTDLDLVIVAPDGDIVGRSDARQPPTGSQQCRPIDAVTPSVPEPGWYRVEVHHHSGSRVGVQVSVVAKGGQFLDPVPDGSVVDPGSQPLAKAVGAVRATGYGVGPLEPYSSWGMTGMRQPKPEIAGPDGLSVTPYGAVGFYGTSASTPVVAGLVALVMSEDPSLSSSEAFAGLQGWAQPPPRDDPDREGYGAGMARLPDLWGAPPVGCGERPLVGAVFGFLGAPWWWRRRRALWERRAR